MKPNFNLQKQEEAIKKDTTYVFKNPISKYPPNGHLGIETISLEDDFTRIDFVYIAPFGYRNGGWIQIDPGCYIRPIGTDRRYHLLQTIDIPMAPTKYYFKRSGQVLSFSLLFSALPKSVKQIDIIEKLGEGNYFNFFKVELQHNAPNLVRIINEN